MNSFAELGLAGPVLRAVHDAGYDRPTPIQTRLIPEMLAGRDVVGVAQTGTGKTAAFVLPILHALAGEREPPTPRRTRALVLAPTRELAGQIERAVRLYGRFLRLRTAVVIGGAGHRPQTRALAGGLDILVATPGRLEEHLRAGALDLSETRTVVLDEADQMLDLGFVPAVRRILAKLPKERHTALLSATMPPAIRRLAAEFLRSPVGITVGPEARPVARIEQQALPVAAASKTQVLADLLGRPGVERAIVFTRTKRGADRLAVRLGRAGHAVAAIHGNKSQGQRERALDAFRTGRATVLVATDVAARGLDIAAVSHVFNYELPDVPEAYVHRIGRTARAGAAGIAVSLVDPAERGLLAAIEKLTGHRFEGFGPPAGGRRAAGPRRAAPPRSNDAGPKRSRPQRRRRAA